jgi:hypothetical protein
VLDKAGTIAVGKAAHQRPARREAGGTVDHSATDLDLKPDPANEYGYASEPLRLPGWRCRS